MSSETKDIQPVPYTTNLDDGDSKDVVADEVTTTPANGNYDVDLANDAHRSVALHLHILCAR